MSIIFSVFTTGLVGPSDTLVFAEPTKVTIIVYTYTINIPVQKQYRCKGVVYVCTVGCKKNGNCENTIDTFLQFFHSVKPSYER
jgi:hypothetical protein